MARLKKGVSFEQLEQFGFRKGYSMDSKETIFISTDGNIQIGGRIWYDQKYYYADGCAEDIFYELVKADLVEKGFNNNI